MKHLTTLLLTLLVSGGCGYSSEAECRVKEMQKCDSAYCEYEATQYCDSEFPGKTKRYIYKEQNYPDNWVRVTVDSYRVSIKATKPRYETVKVCIDKAWTIGKGKCKSVRLNQQKAYPNGQSWSYKDSGADTFYSYIDYENDGNQLKEGTTVTVYLRESVGFFKYHFDWISKFLFWGIAILFSLGIIMFIVGFFLLDDDDEGEDGDEEEDIEEDEYFEEGELVDIPEREALESMTKAEIKEWADAFGFNVPLRLDKENMIDRFVEETEAYVESSDSYSWDWVFAVIGGGLIGWYALLPFLEYLIY